jgi:hypothetical protein
MYDCTIHIWICLGCHGPLDIIRGMLVNTYSVTLCALGGGR